ncbi:MAG: CBS domain-containing protein [Chloroflexia bacterium]|nr:CBS domain-containing protein [Chloroflexia bacterium]
MPNFTRLQELVYEVKIADVMTKDVITVGPDITMGELREILRDSNISGTPVMDQGRMVGIISIEDLIKALVEGGMNGLSIRVGDKMTSKPLTIRSDETVVLAVNYFNRYKFGRFPVVDRDDNLVGILTRGDIISGLLKQLEHEYHHEEMLRHRVSHVFEDLISDLTCIKLHCNVVARDFERAGEASSRIKRALTRLGVSPQIVRRVAIATYELEINIVIHAQERGEVIAEIQSEKIIIRAVDSGPGIPDIEKAMQPGWSTAPAWIREMGFGAGMGLLNVQRCADEMLIESPHGQWTSVKIEIYLNEKSRDN